MLEELRIRGLGAIADATLPLGPGFTAITGETGTGKTMLLSGLGLLLGGRGDSGAIAAGHDRVEVDGRFILPPGTAAQQTVEQAGGLVEDGELIISRTLAREGRSRASAGGRPVPVSVLGEIAAALVTVHGQADQRGLLRAAAQRDALDRFGGPPLADALAAYRARFDELGALDAEIVAVTGEAEQRGREAAELREALEAITAVGPQPGEDEELAALVLRLGQIEALRSAVEDAAAALDADDGPAALPLLATARRCLETAAGRDPALDELAARLAEAIYLLGDLSSELGSFRASLDADPARLDSLQQRLAAIRALSRRFGLDAAGLAAYAEQAAARLLELDGAADRLTGLVARRAGVIAALAATATDLSEHRGRAAVELSAAVAAELQGLAMTGADLRVECRRRPDPHGLLVSGEAVSFGRHGVDEVEFLLAGHRGAAHRPLHRGASGGELSRIMLALEVVLAGAEHPPTFVFDEVDAGVGGRAAVEIGRRLARLSQHAQVLVVTHLPQVAAFAEHHLVVRKAEGDGGVSTVVSSVDGEERIAELSRMLGGLSDSALARGHAAELLELAGHAPRARGSGRGRASAQRRN